MRRPDLVADCANCAAVCCSATSFDACEDFAIDKPVDTPCPNLSSDHRCRIHEQLVTRGFTGCSLYDCYGAGPRVTRAFAARPAATRERNAVFRTLFELHELLWQLSAALELCPAARPELAAQLGREISALDALAQGPLSGLPDRDLTPRCDAARAALRELGLALDRRRYLPLLPARRGR